MSMIDLTQKKCQPCELYKIPLSEEQIEILCKQIPHWEVRNHRKEISRNITFKNFYQTMAFVNAVAWIAHTENHHPMLEVSYQHCIIQYSTHSLGGLSENDFICAAKINALLI